MRPTMELESAQKGFPRVESPSLLVDGMPRLLSELDSYRPLKLSPANCLAQAFDEACRVYYDRPCLGWRRPNGEFAFVSYARFHSDSRRLAQAFQRTLRAGEHVGICGHNCYEWFLCDFACLWTGLCTVPLSDQWDASVMQHVLSHAHVGAVCTTPAHEDSIRAAALAIGSVSHIVTMSLEISAGAQAEPSSVPFTCVSLAALLQSVTEEACIHLLMSHACILLIIGHACILLLIWHACRTGCGAACVSPAIPRCTPHDSALLWNHWHAQGHCLLGSPVALQHGHVRRDATDWLLIHAPGLHHRPVCLLSQQQRL